MPNIWVVGSINMDVVATAKHAPEKGETVMGEKLDYFAGGKGLNQAVAAARLGADVKMVGKLGTDGFSEDLLEFISSENIDTTHITQAEGATGVALITVADGDNRIIVVPEANNKLRTQDVEKLKFSDGDYVLAQLEVPKKTIVKAFKKAHTGGAMTVFNPAPMAECEEIITLTDILIVNETELEALANSKINSNDLEDVAEKARKVLKRKKGPTIMVVTLGYNGALVVTGDAKEHIKGHEVEVVDTTGAGDCFVGALVSMLVKDSGFLDGVAFANMMASKSVQRMGATASMPSLDDLVFVSTKELN